VKRLIVDGADITAVIPRYRNRLVHAESMDTLLHRKRTSVAELADAIGLTQKSLWRFRHRHRVLPIAIGWRITCALHCRIGDFTTQHPTARHEALIESVLWDTRTMPQSHVYDLVDHLRARLHTAAEPWDG
jgi:DNA-binding Xre family transcriptional regulator